MSRLQMLTIRFLYIVNSLRINESLTTTNSGLIVYFSSQTGDQSVPKIIINNTIFIFQTAITVLLTSNYNSFRVLFDKNCFRIFSLKNIFIFLHWKWPAQGTSTVPIVSAHFRSLLAANTNVAWFGFLFQYAHLSQYTVCSEFHFLAATEISRVVYTFLFI